VTNAHVGVRGATYEGGASPSGWDAGGRSVSSDAGSCGVLSPNHWDS